MMTDFRALCAELADAYLRTLEHINNSTWLGYEPSDDPLLQRARAALADEPPEPIPPAALPEGYIDPEHSGDDRALLQTFYSAWCQAEGGTADEFTLQGLRAVLARWGRPAPAPPADGEVAELVAWLRSNALTVKKASGNPANGARQRMNRAAELLQRLASPACMVLKPSPELIEALEDGPPGRVGPLLEWLHPTTVPVSERPWEREGWCDAEGRCWWGTPVFVNSYTVAQSAQWRLSTPDDRFGSELLCLPAHALPLPEVNV